MNDEKLDIRRPAVAGMFYPKSPSELASTIAGYFSEVKKIPVDGRPEVLIVPHAGYEYSGKTAAYAYKLLEGEQYDTVIVISPSHRVFYQGSSVYNGDGYETPLGIVEIDKELSQKIATIHPKVYFSHMGHGTGASRQEHALEVQLPFLQVVLGKFKLVAIVMCEQENDTINALTETLAAVVKGTNTLIVVSTDLSHEHSNEQARQMDGKIQKAVEAYEPDRLWDLLESGKGEACGGGPMVAAMKAAKRLGAHRTHILNYTTSAETTGDFSSVVGYLSAAIVIDKKAKSLPSTIGAMPAKRKPELNEDDKQCLMQIAKDAILAKLEDKKYSPPEREVFKEKKGAFVTIKSGGNLRGCIGQIRGYQPLNITIAEMAVAASFEDPRFPQLTADEYKSLEFEISVLSTLKRVNDINEIKIGRHGLLIKMDLHSGLLLPQVATDNNWSVIQFLEQTCLKAGLPIKSYKEKTVEIYKFTADIF